MTDETAEVLSPREATRAALNELMGQGPDEPDAPPPESQEPPAEPEKAPQDPGSEGEEEPKEQARGPDGKYAKAEKAEAATKAREAAPSARAKGGTAPGAVVPVTPARHAWLRPAIREKWGALDQDVRDEFMRLNGEAARARQEAAESAKGTDGAQAIARVVQPFEGPIRAGGAEPAAYVESLLRTAHALTYAPSQQRSDVLADVVLQFGSEFLRQDGVDAAGAPSCALVRSIQARLAGRPAAPAQGPAGGSQGPSQHDPRLTKLLEDTQARHQAEQEDRANQFGASHEFYEDVREEMGVMLHAMALRGIREVSDEDLERLYIAACVSNPGVAPIYEQRRAAELAEKQRAATQKSRAAAVSIRGKALLEAPRESGKLSPRDAARAALNELMDRA